MPTFFLIIQLFDWPILIILTLGALKFTYESPNLVSITTRYQGLQILFGIIRVSNYDLVHLIVAISFQVSQFVHVKFGNSIQRYKMYHLDVEVENYIDLANFLIRHFFFFIS